MKRAVIYARCSTIVQSTEGFTIAAQVAALEAYAAANGFTVVDRFVDEAVSGTVQLSQRENGKRLLDSVNRGDTDAVLCVRLDRLFRNASNALATVDIFNAQGIALVLLDLGGTTVDTSTTMGKMMFSILSVVGEAERNLISDRVKSVAAYKKKNNQRISRFAPIGYRFDNGSVVKDENEQGVVKMIISLHKSGYSYNKIAAILNSKCVSSRGSRWYANTISSVISQNS